MPKNSLSQNLQYYSVWDRTTRCFHWINVLCIIALIGVGIVILNYKALGVNTDGKVLLKTIHVYIGYIFVLNLIWRLIWAFIGNKHARWKSILPIGRNSCDATKEYLLGVRDGNQPQYLGHNPIAKLMISMLFLLLTTQAITGLVLAGTDLYLPPFGNQVSEWITDADYEAASIKPGYKEGINKAAYAEMRAFRKPFITTHYYVFYILLVFIVLHITAVIVAEIKESNGLVSAMFSGKKILSEKPVDLD